jgi:hypothetical protein
MGMLPGFPPPNQMPAANSYPLVPFSLPKDSCNKGPVREHESIRGVYSLERNVELDEREILVLMSYMYYYKQPSVDGCPNS